MITLDFLNYIFSGLYFFMNSLNYFLKITNVNFYLFNYLNLNF